MNRTRLALQLPLLAVSVAMIVHGLMGPQLAPKNLATLLGWVHYRGLLVLALLVAGNLFCMACPFVAVRDVARRFITPRFHWPRRLRNKWLSIALFVLILFAYELFDLWGSPWWTAWLILAYFGAILAVDCLFKNASFCKYVCPVGQFNFAASTLSPLEIKVVDSAECATCKPRSCIKGVPDPRRDGAMLMNGCESGLFLPSKVGNIDCTFCLNCIKACPHDNVVIAARLPASELWNPKRRSGIGSLENRKDLATLAILFVFGALLNAFGMVSPVYAFMSWIAGFLGTTAEMPVLVTLFVLILVLEPLLLVGGAAYLTQRSIDRQSSLSAIALRFSYAFIPLGFGIWLGHYAFHLLTGFGTVVPVLQQALLDWGVAAFGKPRWDLGGISAGFVYPLQFGFVTLGLVGSLLVAFNIAERDYGPRGPVAFRPWAVVFVMLWLSAVWLLAQPMEMRGTFLGS